MVAQWGKDHARVLYDNSSFAFLTSAFLFYARARELHSQFTVLE